MDKETRGCTLTSCGCIIALLFSWWTDAQLDFWISYFRREEINVPFIFSFLLNLFLGFLMIVLDIISEIGKLVVE